MAFFWNLSIAYYEGSLYLYLLRFCEKKTLILGVLSHLNFITDNTDLSDLTTYYVNYLFYSSRYLQDNNPMTNKDLQIYGILFAKDCDHLNRITGKFGYNELYGPVKICSF